MEQVRTTEIKAHVGERVFLHGWVHQLRALGGINFLLIRDGYGIAQAVSDDATRLSPLNGLQNETVVQIQGDVVNEPQAPGGVELRQISIQVIAPVVAILPVPINKPVVKTSLDTFLNNASLTLRHPRHRALFRISSVIMAAFREYLSDQGFSEIQTPKLVASATESGANVFSVDYFGQQAYLAQSPQFYKQIMVGVYERVFEVGPVFRAEPHDTTRHVNEYVSMDAEMGFIENHYTVMAMLGNLVRHILGRTRERCSAELSSWGVELPRVPEQIPTIHFRDAQQLIYERYGEDCRGEPDLAPQHERWLGEWARETHGSDFLFVPGYPMVKRPFYTHPDPSNPPYSNSFDLLFRGTELVTGGQRLNNYEDYIAALAARNLPTEPFQYYLEAMKYGMPPHGGFAVGLERFVMQMVGLNNIREATLFPRDLHRLAP